jgi:hypothetical protein
MRTITAASTSLSPKVTPTWSRVNANMPDLALSALSSMLTDAVDDELIEANLALQVGRKKRRGVLRQNSVRPAQLRRLVGESASEFHLVYIRDDQSLTIGLIADVSTGSGARGPYLIDRGGRLVGRAT